MAERTVPIQIGVDGQWIVNITLSSSQQVKINQFIRFNIIEETGNLLPTWSIAFIATPELEPEWTESLKLPITIAKSLDSPEKIDTTLQILRPTVGDYQEGFKLYAATGVLYAPAFTQTPFLTTVPNCHGTDLIQKLAKKHFKEVDTKTMTPSSEVQTWFQDNTTDKKFLDFIVPHSYIDKSFVGVGITSGGKYVITDAAKQSQSSPKYTIGGSGSNAIPLFRPPKAQSYSGAMNAFGGYGMDTPIISQDGGIRSVYRPNVEFKFVENTHAEIDNVQRKTLAPVTFGMNTDPKLPMAKANFDYGNALLSMEQVEVTVDAPYFPVQVWDVVQLNYSDTKEGGLNIQYSGKYVVSKVARAVENYMLHTTLILNRDAHNMSVRN